MRTKQNERFLYICRALGDLLGHDSLARLLRRVGVDPAQPEAALPSPMQEATLLRLACDTGDDPALAAKIGLSMREAHTLTAHIAKCSATLRRAIENAGRYYALADPTTSFRLRTSEDGEALEVISSDGALLRHHRYQEFLLFALLSRLRVLANVEFHPRAIYVRHEAPCEPREFERLAGGPVQFGANFNGIVFGSTTLDLPLPSHDEDLVAYLTQLATSKLGNGTGKPSRRAQVEKLIIERLPGNILSADEVARSLGMTRRTLARHLKTEGISFRSIVEDLRYDIAQTYLKDGLSITEIAFYLGYADHASFSTAFRRWSGQSPSSFQKSSAG